MNAAEVERRGLPQNLDAERFVLGGLMVDDSRISAVSELIGMADFSAEAHRRIWAAMLEIRADGQAIDRVTLANRLLAKGQLEAVGGLGYIVSLDEGMPQTVNLDSYARIVKDKANRRKVILEASRIASGAYSDQPIDETARQGANRLSSVADSAIPDSGRLEPIGTLIESVGFDALFGPTDTTLAIPTGFPGLDEALGGGAMPGQLIIIGARPAMGKTALALNIADYAASRGKRVAVFSLEMSSKQLLRRMVCGRSRVSSQRVRMGSFNPEERMRLMEAASQIQDLPLYIDDTAQIGVESIFEKIRRLGGIDVAFVDYLQLMQTGSEENRVLQISALTRTLKIGAKESGCAIFALSQLSRACESRVATGCRPQLSDLRESGSIEQDADVVGFVYRPEVYKPDRTDLRGLAELILAKNRDGEVKSIPLVFMGNITRFESRLEFGIDDSDV